MAQQLSTNTFTAATWIVNTDATKGTHTTLAGALTSASSGDTILLQSSVTENPTFKAGVNVVALPGSQDRPNVSITGKCTFTAAGTVSVSNIQLVTNSDNFLAITGSAASVVNLNNCFLDMSNSTGITFSTSSSSAKLNIMNCQGDLGTTGVAIFSHSSGGVLTFKNSVVSNSGGSSTANTCSNGMVSLLSSYLSNPITFSGTGALSSAKFGEIDTGAENVTALTTVTGTTNDIEFFRLASGTATPFSCGGTVKANYLELNHTNATAISGGGALTYTSIVQDGTVGAISPTSISAKGLMGKIDGTAPSAGTIGELLTASQTTLTTLAVNTITNAASLTPTTGTWEVTGSIQYNIATGVGVTNVQGCLATTNNGFTAIDNFGGNVSNGAANLPCSEATMAPTVLLGPCRMTTTGSTTVFLNAFLAATSAGTRQYTGVIRAVRVA